jgi:hypothetical protein
MASHTEDVVFLSSEWLIQPVVVDTLPFFLIVTTICSALQEENDDATDIVFVFSSLIDTVIFDALPVYDVVCDAFGFKSYVSLNITLLFSDSSFIDAVFEVLLFIIVILGDSSKISLNCIHPASPRLPTVPITERAVRRVIVELDWVFFDSISVMSEGIGENDFPSGARCLHPTGAGLPSRPTGSRRAGYV